MLPGKTFPWHEPMFVGAGLSSLITGRTNFGHGSPDDLAPPDSDVRGLPLGAHSRRSFLRRSLWSHARTPEPNI
jgi:hypothetical protein